MRANTDLLFILSASAIIAFGALFATFVMWAAYRATRMLVRNGTAFGSSVAVRLVSLGISVWLAPAVFSAPVHALVAFVAQFSERAPQLVNALVSYTGSGKINELGPFVPLLTELFVSAPADLIADLHLPDLVFGLALWSCLGSGLDLLLHRESGPAGRNVFALFASLPESTKVKGALVGMLGVGCYLSVAAIVAVPYLRQSAEPTESELEQFGKRIDDSSISSEDFTRRFPSDAGSPASLEESRAPSPVASTEENTDGGQGLRAANAGATDAGTLAEAGVVHARPDAAPAASDSDADSLVTQRSEGTPRAKGVEDTFALIREQRVSEYEQKREKGLQQRSRLKETALAAFATNAGRGRQERARYSTELVIWYRTQISGIEDGLSNCLDGIRTMDEVIEMFASASSPDMPTSSESVSAPLNFLAESFQKLKCRLDIAERPPELQPASRWGPFGAISGWLLASESLDLALITGMLGFGLFGASISTFVRRRAQNAFELTTVGTDIVGVGVRGLSAAMVVFLSALGGMAIFTIPESGKSAEPNPYALFLACLAASVFSEDVWLKVRDRLREQLASRSESTTSPPPASTSETEVPTSASPEGAPEEQGK